jgi:hypothetical protein
MNTKYLLRSKIDVSELSGMNNADTDLIFLKELRQIMKKYIINRKELLPD